MATTTNYNWSTPDDTSLVKDGAAAIRTLGSSIDTTTKALNPSTTLGDIEYRSSTANTNTRLGIGSSGQVLTVSGGVPSWATPAGGGKVLQVVSATYSTQTNNSTNTYADTNLSATITPTLSTSKILVIAGHHHIYKDSGNSGNGVWIKLLRGSTSLAEQWNLEYTATTLQQHGSLTIVYLDSPATTSATTYKTQFKNNVNASYVSVHVDDNLSSITLLEIGA